MNGKQAETQARIDNASLPALPPETVAGGAGLGQLTALAEVRAIYFDLDDTLCGYWVASKAGLKATFEELAPAGVTPESMMANWARAFREFSPRLRELGYYEGYLASGEPSRTEQMRRALLKAGINDSALAERLSARYAEARNSNLKLFPDAIAVLDSLAARYPLGLITNGPADIQRQEIATVGIERYFQHIVIEGEFGKGKPLPELFAHACEALSTQPEQTLMVGNSYLHDVKAAMDAGWKAVWIRRPTDVPPSAGDRSLPEPLPEGAPEPHATITSLLELLDLLGAK